MGSRKASDAPHKNPIFERNFIELQGKKNDTEFAKELGVTRQSVGAWRSGWKLPDLPQLVQISMRTGKSIDWLLGREEHDISTADFDTQMMQKNTGLSEGAIQKLCELKGRRHQSSSDSVSAFLAVFASQQLKLEAFNHFIEDSRFDSLIRAINGLYNPLSTLQALNEKGKEMLESQDLSSINEFFGYEVNERDLRASYYEIVELFSQILSDVTGYKKTREENESIKRDLSKLQYEIFLKTRREEE